MSRFLLAALLVLAPAGLAAQQDASDTCDCGRELAWVAAHAARNYAGFVDKVTPATRPAYDSLLARLGAEAREADTTAECDALLARWVAFFKDRHLGFSRRGATGAATRAAALDTGTIRARFASWETLAVGDEAAVRARLAAQPELDPIEGIWESVAGNYRVAVVRDPRAGAAPREFAMVVLRADSVWWMPGQVKATFERGAGGTYASRFYMQDHSERRLQARAGRQMLGFDAVSPWLRRWPVAAADDTVSLATYRATLNARFDAREVAPGTVVVSVPTFNDPRAMDSLWARHGALIRGAGRLVIDVRGNGGGSDYNFREFLPLLYTGPIRVPGNHVLSTDENLAANLALAADTSWPAAQREQIRRGVERARERRGPDGWWRGEDDVFTTGRVLATPREVAIVHDGGCGSSCEGFVLRARQSRKVTTYGSSTTGVFDYGNVRQAQAPCGTLVLRHPTTRSGYLPQLAVDAAGIAPQVAIPAGEAFPVEWVLRRLGAATAAR